MVYFLIPDFYNVFNNCVKIDGIKTDKDYGNVVQGGIYEDFYNLWFKEFGSKFTSSC